jgi:hypothetical protein
MRVVRFSLRPARELVAGQQAPSCAVRGIGTDITIVPRIVVAVCDTCVSGRDPIVGGGPAANAPHEIETALIGMRETDTCTRTLSIGCCAAVTGSALVQTAAETRASSQDLVIATD